MTRVSFIAPCFNEEGNVQAFYETFEQCFDASLFEWQLVLVDDGSSDNTWKAIQSTIAQADSKQGEVLAIRFSRNFGKEAAIWAGLNNADGDLIGIIDSDLQQPPADALAMCRILEDNPAYDCVAAYQETRQESGPLAAVKRSFYRVFSKLSGMNAIQDASDFRVFRRNVADAILSLPENIRFSKGIFAWIGFDTYAYPYTPDERIAGESKWSPFGLIKYAIEGLLSFSVSPLRVATVLGLFAAFCAVVYFVVILVQTLVTGIAVPGYATLMSVILLLGGAQLVCIGIMGEYVARTYLQGKQRPIYIERDRVISETVLKERNES